MSSVHLACLTESVGSRQRYLMASDPKPPCPKSVCYYEDTEGIVMLLLIWQPILISFLYISTRQPLKCPCRSIPFCIVPEKTKRRGPTVTDKTKPSVLPWVSTCYLVFSYMVIVDKTTSSHRCKRHTIRYRCLPLCIEHQSVPVIKPNGGSTALICSLFPMHVQLETLARPLPHLAEMTSVFCS